MIENKRITLFRAKPIGGGNFVYGSLVWAADGVFIIEEGTSMLFQEPEYHRVGMGCGLEDRGITDRYQAMRHGFDKAVGKCEELHPCMVEVDPGTVGQFTGLFDNVRKEMANLIYEGDIVKVIEDGKESIHQVVYGSEYQYPAFDLKPSLDAECNELQHCVVSSGVTIEVIGNVYENPELLSV